MFAKAPVLGKVKTRLIPNIGAEMACRLHRYLIVTLLHRFIQSSLAPVEIWYCGEGEDDNGFLKACASRFSIASRRQIGSDLGSRMSQAMRASLSQADSVVIVGADCISMTADHINQAFMAVNYRDCVALHPAEDGGYVSIAMRQWHGGIFESVDWGSDRVLSQTLANARKLSLPAVELDLLWDLDRYDDLLRSGIDLSQLSDNHTLCDLTIST